MDPVGALTRETAFPVWTAASFVALWLTVGPIPAAAQAVAPSALKAAFLFNFARFAEWPALAPDAPVNVCIFGDDLVATALVDTLRGQSIDAHGLQLVQLPSDVSVRSCQVLFVGGADAQRATALVDEASVAPVLTVSDANQFAENGGMVELFVEAGRMKFAINVDVVQRSRIRLSSRVLGLARIVRNGHDH